MGGASTDGGEDVVADTLALTLLKLAALRFDFYSGMVLLLPVIVLSCNVLSCIFSAPDTSLMFMTWQHTDIDYLPIIDIKSSVQNDSSCRTERSKVIEGSLPQKSIDTAVETSKRHKANRSRISHCEKKLARHLFDFGVVNTKDDDCKQQVPSVVGPLQLLTRPATKRRSS